SRFRGATLFLERSRFRGATLFFERSRFRGATLFLERSRFRGATLFFERSRFRGPTLFFQRSRFRGPTSFLGRSGFGGDALLFRLLGLSALCGGSDRGLRLLTPPPNLNPDVVTTARRHHIEPVVGLIGQPVLDGAKFIEGAKRICRQQLRQHADGGVEREIVRRNVQRIRSHHDVRTLTDVHDERVAVGANDRREEGISESH
ncbi:MAG TPA: hypothetical protein VF239_08955, partial [Vicinamibacterales bacterium]